MQNTRKLNLTYSENVPCARYKDILGSGGKTPSILASARDRNGQRYTPAASATRKEPTVPT